MKSELHPRNRHRDRYDFKALIQVSPELAKYVSVNPYGDESIDFADPAAVKALNRALLKQHYEITSWDIPVGYLCPPIPGRADYIHHVADLMASYNRGTVPKGESIRVLDVGAGANCIYPLIGAREYGWSFVGTETDPVALASAKKIVESNSGLNPLVQLRLQKSPQNIFKGIWEKNESFHLTICNPPFHSSLDEAKRGTQRKWKNLGKGPSPQLNFGGKGSELWCPGGEVEFVRRMIEESREFSERCPWFTSLVSKEVNLPQIYLALEDAEVLDVRTIEMSQGQKKSRIIAWTFN